MAALLISMQIRLCTPFGQKLIPLHSMAMAIPEALLLHKLQAVVQALIQMDSLRAVMHLVAGLLQRADPFHTQTVRLMLSLLT